MTQKPLRAFILITLMSLIPATGHAAGLFVGEVGTHALSRGGALIVNPNAPSAAFLNPAALAFLKGTQLQCRRNIRSELDTVVQMLLHNGLQQAVVSCQPLQELRVQPTVALALQFCGRAWVPVSRFLERAEVRQHLLPHRTFRSLGALCARAMSLWFCKSHQGLVW